MRNNKIRAMSVGAMIAAIYGALFFLDMNFANTLGYYLYFILPILIIYYVYHFGIKQASVLGIVVFFITLFTASPISLFYAITSIIAGLAIGYGHTHHFTSNQMLFTSVSISLLNNILSYTVLSKMLEMDLILELKEIYEMISKYMNVSMTLEQFYQYGPLLIIMMGCIEGYLLLMISSLILPRFKIKFKYHFNFLTMQLPFYIGILGVLFYIGAHVMNNIYLNYFYLIFFYLIILQGFALIALIYISKKHYILYMLSCIGCFLPYIRDFYFLVGILDIVIGFKKKIMYNGHN